MSIVKFPKESQYNEWDNYYIWTLWDNAARNWYTYRLVVFLEFSEVESELE